MALSSKQVMQSKLSIKPLASVTGYQEQSASKLLGISFGGLFGLTWHGVDILKGLLDIRTC